MKKTAAKILKIVLWTILALMLIVSAALICAVSFLKPERLTPMIERVANKTLDADVSIGRAELAFRPAFPVINLQIDTLVVISHAFNQLDGDQINALPAYRDTLLSIDRFSGALDLGAMITKGEIAIRNVEVLRPALNIVLDRNSRGNFEIFKDNSSDSDTSAGGIPPISISRFAFVQPREIRYFNAADSTDASILLLNDVVLDGSRMPLYSLRVNGTLSGPYPRLLQADELRFALDGRMKWDPEHPCLFSFDDFTICGAFAKAKLDAVFDIDSSLNVLQARMALEPVKIEDFLSVLPDSLRRVYQLTPPLFSTDGAIGLTASLDTPFSPQTDSIPNASINICMADCSMRYGKARFSKIGFDADIVLRDNNIDSALVSLNRFVVAGPATELNISGSAQRLVSDPFFDARLHGDMRLKNIPPILAEKLNGIIDGRIDMKLSARGRLSMFSHDMFHDLDVKGMLSGRNLYYLSNDSATLAKIDNMRVRFGSQERFRDSSGVSAPTLAAGISVDIAHIFVDDIRMIAGNLALGVGVENRHRGSDSTLVVPLGGGIKIGMFDLKSTADSAGMRLRDLAGHIGVKRYQGKKRLPLITAEFEVDRMSAGNPNSRFMIKDAHIDASMFRRPSMLARYKAVKYLSDSISRRHPDLPIDSVYRLAFKQQRINAGFKSRARENTHEDADDYEMLDWGLSKGMRRFILNWQIEGKLSTNSARLFTPLFPLRNNINELDLDFSIDSISLNKVNWLVGNSDISMKGVISNLRKALISKRSGNDLKINFDIESDTIDINQISAAAFAGSAYAESVRNGSARMIDISADIDSLDEQLDSIVAENVDSVAPILVPANIDATIALHADNVIYSDLLLNNLNGQILAYGGGVNLHELSASSDAGNVTLYALYSAPKIDEIQFGFGLQLERFKVERFLRLVPAVDSIMPLIRDFSGIVNADIAASVDIDSAMNMVLPSLDAAIKLSGDSLAFINADTYQTLGKWLRFRNKADNKIKHMSVEFLIRDNEMETFPFAFDIDRYRLGVVGRNDLAFNFNYHISVLKSPLPFKFGINIKGNPDKYKVRFGGAKFKEGKVVESVNIVDTVRVNLVNQIENIFKRGVQNSRFSRIELNANTAEMLNSPDSGLSGNDSILLRNEGILPPDDKIIIQDNAETSD